MEMSERHPAVQPGRWTSRRVRQQASLGYRKPAPSEADRPPPIVSESGEYQALRDGWLRRVLRRWLS